MLIYLPFTNYLFYCVAIIGLYYFIVWLLYFTKKQPLQIATSKQTALFSEPRAQNNLAAPDKIEPDLSPIVHDLVDELTALLLQSSAEEATKEDLSKSIIKLLHKYDRLKGSGFQPAILNLVAVETENQCNIHFDADELTALWN